ncbi:unnamed protein product [Sympodiomycopsis kandeliae]
MATIFPYLAEGRIESLASNLCHIKSRFHHCHCRLPPSRLRCSLISLSHQVAFPFIVVFLGSSMFSNRHKED